MSLRRPFQYSDADVEFETYSDPPSWHQCYGCYRKKVCQVVEIKQRTRRCRSWLWTARWLCGECTALILAEPFRYSHTVLT